MTLANHMTQKHLVTFTFVIVVDFGSLLFLTKEKFSVCLNTLSICYFRFMVM